MTALARIAFAWAFSFATCDGIGSCKLLGCCTVHCQDALRSEVEQSNTGRLELGHLLLLKSGCGCLMLCSQSIQLLVHVLQLNLLNLLLLAVDLTGTCIGKVVIDGVGFPLLVLPLLVTTRANGQAICCHRCRTRSGGKRDEVAGNRRGRRRLWYLQHC